MDSRLYLNRGVPNGLRRLLVKISICKFLLFGRECVKKGRGRIGYVTWVGRGWKAKMRQKRKDSDDFFHNPGTPLLNARGRISQLLSHHAVAGLDTAISKHLQYKSALSHFNS